jgi:hypothetical protein
MIAGCPTVDGASRAPKTLGWLLAHGYRGLVEHAVVVLSHDRASRWVERRGIREHFAARCQAFVDIPPDRHLAIGGPIRLDELRSTGREAYLRLAAHVAEQFARPATRQARDRRCGEMRCGEMRFPPRCYWDYPPYRRRLVAVGSTATLSAVVFTGPTELPCPGLAAAPRHTMIADTDRDAFPHRPNSRSATNATSSSTEGRPLLPGPRAVLPRPAAPPSAGTARRTFTAGPVANTTGDDIAAATSGCTWWVSAEQARQIAPRPGDVICIRTGALAESVPAATAPPRRIPDEPAGHPPLQSCPHQRVGTPRPGATAWTHRC